MGKKPSLSAEAECAVLVTMATASGKNLRQQENFFALPATFSCVPPNTNNGFTVLLPPPPPFTKKIEENFLFKRKMENLAIKI